MTKKEFIKSLKSKLSILKEEELKDIITEYEDHIDLEVKNGKKEADVIASFGSIDELANEILDAYKINTSKKNNQLNDLGEILEDIVEKIVEVLKVIASKFNDNAVAMLFQILALLIVAFFLKIPFHILDGLGSGMIRALLPYGFEQVVVVLWNAIVWLGYIVTIVSIFVSHFTKPEYSEYVFKRGCEDNEKQEKKEKKEYKEVVNEEQGEIKKRVITRIEKVSNDRHSEYNSSSLIINVLAMVFKLFVIILILPFVFMMLGLVLVLGMIIKLFTVGVSLYGALFIIIGIIIIVGTIVDFIFHNIFRVGGRY